MARKSEMIEKMQYLGLDLNKIPKQLKQAEDLEFRVPKFYDDSQYKQYRYINVNDIQILLTPGNRLDDLEEKYKKASPLVDFLDSESEENYIKHTTFLNMLKNVSVERINEIEEEQEKLNKEIPFKVKFSSNYLWQIYYSKNTDKYFMLVPTDDSEYEAFFYLLKKKLENKKTSKIFVPISGIDYTTQYLRKSEYQDIENYMWLFTKEWPLIYEVYDKNNDLSIQIIGQTYVYEKIKSLYRIKLENKEQATTFYKLVKAMFILQTELPNYFEFRTNINKDGGIDFYQENRKIEYKDIADWLKEEYALCDEKKDIADELIKTNNEKLEKLKSESVLLDLEYIEKEKQISTFLECKKSFFGKVKYYFKYSKSKKKKDKSKAEIKEEVKEEIIEKVEEVQENNTNEKENYTIEELIQNYKELEEKENNLKNILMDINALKLKNKNLTKKIENATTYIKEIDSHKKSIFEFWKYSNKDEIASLPEGEQEEINVIKKITRVFDYEEDLEDFGKKYDRVNRKKLSQEETDALYITNTNVLEVLDKIKNNEILPKEIENNLKQIKKEAIEEKTLSDNEEFDIFSGTADSTKVSKINNKKHRELAKDRFKILDISKNTKQIGYKLALEQIVNNIKNALEKVEIDEELPIYKAQINEINKNNINLFNLNPALEVWENLNDKVNDIKLYKINLKGKVKCIPYTNIIFYDNQNKTLPLGMDLSTKLLIDLNKIDIKEKNNFEFCVINFENKDDEFSKININKINVIEYDINSEVEE